MPNYVGGRGPTILFHLRHLIKLLESIPFVRQITNRVAINFLIGQTLPRPHPYSLWTPGNAPLPPQSYVSWTGLVDRTFTGRHLPPASPQYTAGLPDINEVGELFRRQRFTPSRKSSAFFCFFAQWFTDSFLRTSTPDSRRTTSNHDIDLCQIYGLDAATAAMLREGAGGRLRTRVVNGEVFPPLLFAANGSVEPHFAKLGYVQPQDPNAPNGPLVIDKILEDAGVPQALRPARRARLYATGLERGNSTILYTAISSIFIREHNRICAELHNAYPGWDDDRLFETARNINIVLLLRLIIEEYINHLADLPFRFFVDHSFPEMQPWYRTNRISLEFNLLYRWHSLVPTTFSINHVPIQSVDFRFNNELLEQHGAERTIAEASAQRAGRIGLGNTADFLLEAEKAAIRLSRTHRLRPYNEYRTRFGMLPVVTFEELTGEVAMAAYLRAIYGHVDRVEFVVGLFAEWHPDNAILGELTRIMVAVDAFSQALTNPLLSRNVFGEDTFSDIGLKIIERTRTFQDLMERNSANNLNGQQASFDARGQAAA